MSLAVRQALATAATAVADVDCDPHFIQSTRPGSAMVRLDRIEYPNAFGGICHWNVIVMLPQDQAQAEQWIDNHKTALREAIAEELVITSIQPQRLETKTAGVLLCVFINGHREEE